MLLNLLVVAIFVLNFALRWDDRDAKRVSAVQLLLSLLGTGVLGFAVYLGGRMTFDYGVSVARHSKKRWRAIAQAAKARLPEESS